MRRLVRLLRCLGLFALLAIAPLPGWAQFSLPGAKQAQACVLSGRIAASAPDSLAIKTQVYWYDAAQTLAITAVDAEGRFRLRFRLDQPRWLRTELGPGGKLFLQPGDSLHVQLPKGLAGPRRFSGDRAKANRVLGAFDTWYQKQWQQARARTYDRAWMRKSFLNQFGLNASLVLDSLWQGKAWRLDPRHEAFLNASSAEYVYRSLGPALRLALDTSWIQKAPDEEQEAAAYLASLMRPLAHALKLYDPSLMQHAGYREFLTTYVAKLQQLAYLRRGAPELPQGMQARAWARYQNYRAHVDTSVRFRRGREYLIAEELDRLHPKLSYDRLRAAIRGFAARFPNSRFLHRHPGWLATARRLKAGKPAPAFRLRDSAGRAHRLAELRGEWVYLDFWASWCRPCIEAIPDLKQLRQRLDSLPEPVQIVTISLDNSRSAWLRMLALKHLPGLHLHAPQAWQSKVVQQYGVNGIPSYYLINPQGKLAQVPCLGPGQGAFEQLRRRMAAGQAPASTR